MNSITLVAQAITVPELRHTQNQVAIAQFQIQFSVQEDVIQCPVTIWGKKAEELALQEGSVVLIQGRMQINAIDRPEGFKEKQIEINAQSVTPIDGALGLNKVILVGRTGRDAEVRFFESGSIVANAAIAVNRSKDITDWFDLEAWSKTAETFGNYVRKGSLIGVEGSLTIQSWTDRSTGAARSKPVIKVDRLSLLGSRKDNEEPSQGDFREDEFTPPAVSATAKPKAAAPSPYASTATKGASKTEKTQEINYDDIPF